MNLKGFFLNKKSNSNLTDFSQSETKTVQTPSNSDTNLSDQPIENVSNIQPNQQAGRRDQGTENSSTVTENPDALLLQNGFITTENPSTVKKKFEDPETESLKTKISKNPVPVDPYNSEEPATVDPNSNNAEEPTNNDPNFANKTEKTSNDTKTTTKIEASSFPHLLISLSQIPILIFMIVLQIIFCSRTKRYVYDPMNPKFAEIPPQVIAEHQNLM